MRPMSTVPAGAAMMDEKRRTEAMRETKAFGCLHVSIVIATLNLIPSCVPMQCPNDVQVRITQTSRGSPSPMASLLSLVYRFGAPMCH